MMFDMEALSGTDTYKLLASTIVPRPIAWITTVDERGAINAAPYSFFNALSGSPPIVCVGIGNRGTGERKDTGDNIRTTGEFVVNLVNFASAEPMNVTAIEFPHDVDELAAAGLTHVPATRVRPPLIAQSPVSLECVRHVAIEIGINTTIVLGRVLAVHVRDDCVLDADRCYIDTLKLDLVGRMHGGGGYSRAVAETFEIPRLTPLQFAERPRS